MVNLVFEPFRGSSLFGIYRFTVNLVFEPLGFYRSTVNSVFELFLCLPFYAKLGPRAFFWVSRLLVRLSLCGKVEVRDLWFPMRSYFRAS